MKRVIITFLSICICLSAYFNVAGQRKSARPPKKTSAKTPATVKPLNVDGEWHGTTSQGREISLVVKSNTIVLYKVGYGIPSRGCFIVPEVDGATKVTWDETSTYAPKVTGNSLKISQPSTSGGINASPISYLKGSFSADGMLSGSISFTAVTRAGEPLCQSQIDVTFSAKKVEGGTVENASVAKQQPAAEPVPPPRSLPPGQEYEITDVKINDGSGTVELDQPLKIRMRLYRSANSRPRSQTFVAVDLEFTIKVLEFEPSAPGTEQPLSIEVELRPDQVIRLSEQAGQGSFLRVAIVTLSTAIGGEIVRDDISNPVKTYVKVLK